MANLRVFTQYEDEQLSIAGRVFDLKPLPSGKVAHLADLVGDTSNVSKILEDITSEINEDMSTSEELKNVAKRIFESRFRIVAFALQIDESSDKYKELEAAIDDASFPEIFWLVDQIVEINGLKRLEKMMRNLTEAVKSVMPDMKDHIRRLLKKYSEDQELKDRLTARMREIRATPPTGLTSSPSDSEENPTDSPTPLFSESSP